MDIIHFADPFCWWSWGLEPILHRLKEVYGDQVEVTYRMGGMASSIDQWRKSYNVTEDKTLRSWISKSISMTGMPLDADFIVKSSAQSSWPACVAVKAAELQNKELAAKFFRRIMEATQLRSVNVSEEDVYLAVAKEIGLDLEQLRKDISSGNAVDLFDKDRKEMNVNFSTLVLMNKRTQKSKAVGGVFTSNQYESAIEELSGGKLRKKVPVDILEYFRHLPNCLIPAKEIAVVFGISVQDAEKRLGVLSEGALLRSVIIAGDKKLWTAAGESERNKELTTEQLNAARIVGAAT
ncbi:MAG TPA: DsbA family protein [Kofleriaceae bacterium]|nr:DsbA family protein [Kofleriaceae bacterium]